MVFRRSTAFLLVMFVCSLSFVSSFADFIFSDHRFQNNLTTENLNAIIDEYELYDGWYWTTMPDIVQTFHGHAECPGWTDTAVNVAKKKAYKLGWFGCRWPIERVKKNAPDKGGYAECFAFAQFIGYLLSGDINPQHHWKFYYSLESAESLQVGDIVRVEYSINKKEYYHSAVVYSVNGEEILFLQVSGNNYNRISVGTGFTDGNFINVTSEEEISEIPGLKISRYDP